MSGACEAYVAELREHDLRMPAAYHRTSEESTVGFIGLRLRRHAGSATDEDGLCLVLVEREHLRGLVVVPVHA